MENKSCMALPSSQIAIELLLISIGIVVAFDIKIDLFKSKRKTWISAEITLLI